MRVPSSPCSPSSSSPPHHHRTSNVPRMPNASLSLSDAAALPGFYSARILGYSGHCSRHQHGSCPTSTPQPTPPGRAQSPTPLAAAAFPALVRDITAPPQLGSLPKPHGHCVQHCRTLCTVQHRSKRAEPVALGGDKGRDMPGPAPSPAHSCPPVPRATLAPAAQRGEGESRGFPSVAVVWLCRVFPGIFGLWEASLATRVLQALTASCSRYKKQATAFCRMQIAWGHPKKCTQEEGKRHRMHRTGTSSERGVWGPGLEAESDACCKTSAGNSAHRCPGFPFPMPPQAHAASAQQCQPPQDPYTSKPDFSRAKNQFGSISGSRHHPGIVPAPLLPWVLPSPQAPWDPSHRRISPGRVWGSSWETRSRTSRTCPHQSSSCTAGSHRHPWVQLWVPRCKSALQTGVSTVRQQLHGAGAT